MPSKPTTTPILAAALLALSSSSSSSSSYLPLASAATTTCDSVELIGDSLTRPSDGFYQISPVVDCSNKPSKRKCRVKSGDYAPVLHPTFNISTVPSSSSSDVTTAAFLQLFYDAMPEPKPTTVNLNTTSVVNFSREQYLFSVRGGESGYAAFTPFLTCYDGKVSGCNNNNDDDDDDDDAIRDGKVLRLCAPTLLDSADMTFDPVDWNFSGDVSLVKTDSLPEDDDDDDEEGDKNGEPGLKSYKETEDQNTNDVGDYIPAGEGAAASLRGGGGGGAWYGTLGLGLLISALVL